jgi:hypothetical protein
MAALMRFYPGLTVADYKALTQWETNLMIEWATDYIEEVERLRSEARSGRSGTAGTVRFHRG